MRPAKTQISLGIAQSDQSSLSAWRKFGSLATHWAHSKVSDQSGRMPRLIWVFAGRTVILLVFSWGGSYDLVFIYPITWQLLKNWIYLFFTFILPSVPFTIFHIICHAIVVRYFLIVFFVINDTLWYPNVNVILYLCCLCLYQWSLNNHSIIDICIISMTMLEL